MKKLRIIFTTMLIASLATVFLIPGKSETAQASPSPKSLKVLAIGNSFSDDGTHYLYEIAKAAGYDEVILGNLAQPGQSLEGHWNNKNHPQPAVYHYYTNRTGSWINTLNTRMDTGLLEEDWDFITFQQASSLSGDKSTFEPYLNGLIDYVKEKVPGAKLGWHMTWAYHPSVNHNYGSTQISMYNAILDAVKTGVMLHNEIAFVIPSGTALQNARSSYFDDSEFTTDGMHLKPFGKYIAGLAWFKELTGEGIDNISTTTISPTRLAVARDAVNAAIANPFGVTPSSFGESERGMVLLDWQPQPSGYWDSAAGHQRITGDSEQHRQYVSSAVRITREQLPVGSIIKLNEGYTYRAELWTGENTNENIPDIEQAPVVIVDEEWWGGNTYAAFNLQSVVTGTDLTAEYEAHAANLRIFVPYAKSQYQGTVKDAEILGKNDGAVVLKSFSGYQYSIDGGLNWQLSPFFYGLQASTEYHFIQRVAATETVLASPSSAAVSATTDQSPAEVQGREQFQWQPVPYGYWNSAATPPWSYSTSTPLNRQFISSERAFTKEELPLGTVIIVDEGFRYRPDRFRATGVPAAPRPDNITQTMTIIDSDFWEGWESVVFNLSAINSSNIADNPINALRLRIYLPGPKDAYEGEVLQPIVLEKNEYSITLQQQTGYEYSIDGVKWQSNNLLSGLMPDIEYTVYQRVAETIDVAASQPQTKQVRTQKAIAGSNLMQNGAFEQGQSGTQPIGWSQGIGATGSISTAQSRTGLQSMTFKATYPWTSPGYDVSELLAQNGAGTYKFTAWVLNFEPTGNTISAAIRNMSKAETPVVIRFFKEGGADKMIDLQEGVWTKLEADIEVVQAHLDMALSGDQLMLIFDMMFGNQMSTNKNGIFFIDDISLEKVADNEKPTIEVEGMPHTGNTGAVINLPKATVIDPEGDEVEAVVTVKGPNGEIIELNGLEFTPTEAGEYTVTYSAADSAGIRADDKVFAINVEFTLPKDEEKPVITVSGVPTEGTVNTKIKLPEATVTDNVDYPLDASVTVIGPDGKRISAPGLEFTPTQAGKYTVTYSAADTAGNRADELVFEINVTGKGGCGSSILTDNIYMALVVIAAAGICVALLRKKAVKKRHNG